MFVGFGDDTAVFSDGWDTNDAPGWKATQRGWYTAAIAASGEQVTLERFYDPASDEVVVSVSMYLGKMNNLDTVLGADFIVPRQFFN